MRFSGFFLNRNSSKISFYSRFRSSVRISRDTVTFPSTFGYIECMKKQTIQPSILSDDVISPFQSNRHLDIPDWNTASHLIFPFLESVSVPSEKHTDVIALNPFDTLSGMVTNYIKMTLTLFYHGTIIPLTESMIRDWSITIAGIQLAMESNMALLARSSRFELHKKGTLYYYSVHSDAAPFNSVLPFYAPFQEAISAMIGSPFYFAVPERRTVILFGKETLSGYLENFHDDIFLAYETSTSALSPELIEVSESGVIPIYR